MSEQLQKKRPVGSSGTSTDEQVPVPVEVGSTDAMQQALKDAADALAAKAKVTEQKRVVKKRRPPCCCC
jgi:hypothetical protein